MKAGRLPRVPTRLTRLSDHSQVAFGSPPPSPRHTIPKTHLHPSPSPSAISSIHIVTIDFTESPNQFERFTSITASTCISSIHPHASISISISISTVQPNPPSTPSPSSSPVQKEYPRPSQRHRHDPYDSCGNGYCRRRRHRSSLFLEIHQSAPSIAFHDHGPGDGGHLHLHTWFVPMQRAKMTN